MVGNWKIDLYWGRLDRACRCISLLGTLWYEIGRYISSGDGLVYYVAEDLYWGGVIGYGAVNLYW